jgi:hypothetical protein
MRHTIALAACLAATPCLAGGEPSPPYYPAPAPYYAPPYYAPWPNPIDVLVGGALAIPGVVLGGLFGAITPPVAVSCVGPGGSLSPCPAGPAPAYPAYPPAYGPGYAPMEPAPPPSGYYAPPDPPGPSSGARTMLPRHSSGQPCYDQSGQWQGDGNPECSY